MLRTTTADLVAWLTFDRPARLNAFTGDDYRDLRVAVDQAAGDPAIRAIVLTGAGRAFSAGADRSLLDPAEDNPQRDAAGVEFASLLRALAECEKPLLAAVNGLAVGFGCTMLLYCDLVLAAESARFRFPFTALGIVPEAGSTALLPARARWDETLWATLSSEWLDAAAAQRLGLVWRLTPDDSLHGQTAATAAAITAHDPASVAATKRLMTAGRAEAARQADRREVEAMGELQRRGRS
jgi:enoyl-CoA hydratase/carnithine racemase